MSTKKQTQGQRNQLTKQIGEYLVSAQLCRMGWISTTFTGNVPEFDIVALKKKETRRVQVKTIHTGAWQFDARRFLKIEQREDEQHVTGKTKLHDDEIIYVFVMLEGLNEDDYYICSINDVQKIQYKGYKIYLKDKNNIRPKNPKSYHFALTTKHLAPFKDAWDAYF